MDGLHAVFAGHALARGEVLHVMRSQRSVSELQTVSAGQSAILQPPAATYVTAATPTTPAANAPLPRGVVSGTTPLCPREPGQPNSIVERTIAGNHRPIRITKRS